MRTRLKLIVLSLTPLAASMAIAAGADTKIIVPKGMSAPAGFERVVDYGSFALYRGRGALAPKLLDQSLLDADMLFFDRQPFDTQRGAMVPPAGFALSTPPAGALQIVQFVGPMKDEWLVQLRRFGMTPVQYIANNGYLLWADAFARTQLDDLVADGGFLQYSAPLASYLKLGPTLAAAIARGETGSHVYTFVVQRYRAPGDGRVAVSRLGLKPETDWTPILAFENARFTGTLDQLRAVAELPDVFWVGEVLPRQKLDEVQATIIRGHFAPGQAEPASEGYKGWLESLSFPSTPSSYPIVDVTDDGIGNRTTNSGDPTLHEGGLVSNPSRVIYSQACTPSNGTVDGHGHINTNIIGGFDVRTNAATAGARFPGEYQRGQGMNPWARVGGTRIFDAAGFSQVNCGGNDAGVIKKLQDAGATISNNSWGCSGCAGTYDDSSQTYDAGVRDADTAEPGNQQVTFVFSAGNSGPGAATLGTPGNGKNMISVGASENARPTDESGNWTDGCGVGPTGADNAMDVIDFSSRGPAPGNRKKPEVIAPGTHISGTQANPTNGTGTCDAARPLGNVTYSASSGTSHSGPAIAGVASLVDYWVGNGRGVVVFDGGVASAPTPALQKAWMMAHPTYLTGVDANDTLPSNAQGYGMPNLQNMFNDVPKFVVNQTRVLAATGEQFSWIGSMADPLRPFRVALAYTDKPGAIGTSPQVNNLDLEAIVDGVTYRGNVFTGAFSSTGGIADALNNYEAVFLPAGTGTAVEIRVIGANIADDGVPGDVDMTDQDFALVCDNCSQSPTFSLVVDTTTHTICTQVTNSVDHVVNVGSILGFASNVTLSVTGQPPASTTNFSGNPVTPPGSSTLTIGNLGSAAFGTYPITLTGTAGSESKNRALDLIVHTANPTSATLTAPADAATNVVARPTFTWDAGVQAADYTIEVDDSADFSSLVYSGSSTSNSHTPTSDLPTNTVLFWRVRANNSCGSLNSPVRSFTTVALPGDCSLGTTPTVSYVTGFESGPSGWTLGAGSSGASNWAITTARTHAGSNAFLAQDLAALSDQRLVSPVIALPNGQTALTLSYFSHQILESRTGGCFDGGLLEVSTDGGTTWTQIGSPSLLTDPYDGLVSTDFSSPIANLQAWCENPPPANAPVWTKSVVDIDSFAGQSVQFRFRVGTDTSVGSAPHGFYLDDVQVQGCTTPNPFNIFNNGFE
ncbi:MAG: hypothetical protein COS34_06605 [Lysobacterales bacterium CG02_land_8_20_14_3_00_62_12]|nr:MAG: hypothetical protein COS34_06605 [Xanthomonadales bacterium CG02_land_8_20_14_3_00_62_12]